MPRLNHHAVTGQADILLCDDICPADMRLFARCNADVTARRADGAEALALGGTLLAKIVGGLAAADGEANAARAHQAGLFGLLKAPGSVGVGRRHDVHIVACGKGHIAVASDRRT